MMRTFSFRYTNSVDDLGTKERPFQTEAEAMRYARRRADEIIAGSGKEPAEWELWYVAVTDDIGNANAEPFVPLED
jgi:hypothetical protein